MSLHVLAQGTLTADPQQRTSSAAKPYCTAQMRVPADGADGMLASLIAFEPAAVKALMQLRKGDSCSVAGGAKLTSWVGKDKQQRHGVSITVQRVMTLYEARKRKREASAMDEAEEMA